VEGVRFLRQAVLGLAACVTSVVVACSGSSSSGGELGAATTGPLRGTYSADSDDGDSPFASITFLENDRFEAIENNCYADTTPGNCVHTGSYALEGDSVVLDDDGGGKTTIPLDDAQVTTVANSSGTSGGGGNSLLAAKKPDDLVVVTFNDAGDAGDAGDGGDSGDGGDASDAAPATTTGSAGSGGGVVITIHVDAGGDSLLGGSGGLLANGQVVISFPLGGTPMVQAGSPSTASPSSGTPLVSSPGSTTTPSTSSPSSSTTPSSSPSSTSTPSTDGSIVTAGAVGNALTWVSAQVPYCGGVNNGPDSICGGTCRRTGAANNPQWNPYRSDCSGLVSFAWGLPAPGLTTKAMAPLSASKSTAIPGTSLQPGDALNSGHHVVLFQKWINQSAGSATIIEESDCHLVAMTKNVTLKVGASPSVQMGSSTYTAIRAKSGLVNGGS
jgi:hypothetical protein